MHYDMLLVIVVGWHFYSGMKPLIYKVLVKYMGELADELNIVANNGRIEGREWEILYIDDT